MHDPKSCEQQEGLNCSDWTLASESEQLSGASSTSSGLSRRQTALLEKLIETSIVPRLLLASRSQDHPLVGDSAKSAPITVEHISELAELVIRQDAKAALAYFEDRRTQGFSIETLFQDLLVPVAQRLGELWDEDINDFMDVTRGAGHLQLIIREYCDAFRREAQHPFTNRRMLLMTMPGENHTIGISIVGEHFRRAGWHVWGGPSRSIDDILELVGGEWFDVVGLSMSRITDPASVASDIAGIRRASKNQGVIIQVGGGPFSRSPDLAVAVGADYTAPNADQAVKQITETIVSSGVPRL